MRVPTYEELGRAKIMSTDELQPAGWYPDPTGQPGQKFWDGQTLPATGPPTIAVVRTLQAGSKRIALAVAVVLMAVAESWIDIGLFWPFVKDSEDGPDPVDDHA
jgi:hypothetical protein